MNRAIVPYATRAVTSGKYGRAARLIGMAYRRYAFRKRVATRTIRGALTAYRAARTIGSGVRWYMKQKGTRISRGVSRPRGNNAPTPAIDFYGATGHPLGRLYIDPVNFPIRDATQPNTRRNNTLMVSGIKYCHVFYTPIPTSAGVLDPKNLDVHFALVQIKGQPQVPGSWDSTTIYNKIADHMFRERSSSVTDVDSRVRPFNNATSTNQNFDFGKSCLSLAPESFSVIFHKQFPLYRRYLGNGIAEGNKPHMRKIAGYLKVKKNITFPNNQDIYGTSPFVFLTWCNTLTRDEWPPTYAIADEYLKQEQRRCIYWHNT